MIAIPAMNDDEVVYFSVQSKFIDKKNANIVTGFIDEAIMDGVQIVLTFLRNQKFKYKRILKKKSIHIHFDDYSFHKEGSSAMLGIFLSIYLLINKIKKFPDVLITGEIDLLGNVVEVGGIKEKGKFYSEQDKFNFFISPNQQDSQADIKINSLFELEEKIKELI